MSAVMWWLSGFCSGYVLHRVWMYLDDIKGDVFCFAWPRCWKRATHYIVTEDTAITDEGMCERHAHLRAVELITEVGVDPAICTFTEAVNRARLNRALYPNDED